MKLALWPSHQRIAAGVLVFAPDGRLLLIKSRARGAWEYPAGGSHSDEAPFETACRELREEAGLQVPDLRFVGIDYYSRQVFRNKIMVTFAATIAKEQMTSVHIQYLEVADYRWVTRAEAAGLIAPRLQERLINLLVAYDADVPVYLENGKRKTTR